jgi:hypothetical protein
MLPPARNPAPGAFWPARYARERAFELYSCLYAIALGRSQ